MRKRKPKMRSLEALGMPVGAAGGSAGGSGRSPNKKAGPAAIYKNLSQVCAASASCVILMAMHSRFRRILEPWATRPCLSDVWQAASCQHGAAVTW